LLPLLERALGSVDVVLVTSGDNYRVVPRSSARTMAQFNNGPSTSAIALGYSTDVVQLKHASAVEISRLLVQFLGKDIVAGTNDAYNQVLITGNSDERQSARELIQRFDVDQLAGMTFNIFHLENVDPDTIYADLQKVFQPPLDIIGSRVRIIPLPRLHALLEIAADRTDITRIEPWIRQLDEGGSGKRKLYSYVVQNGRARDLAASLQAVLGASDTPTPATSATSQQTQLQFPSANSSPSLSSDMATGSAGMPPPPSTVIASQTPLPGPATPLDLSTASGSGPRIVPNDDTNSLLIYATGEEYDLIREALERLDRPVPEILIQAVLAEVSLTKDLSAGVDWSYLNGNSSFHFNNTSASVPTPIYPGFSYNYMGLAAQVVLNTLQSKTNVKVLSTPKLMVLNNQTATLQVGDEVPIVTQQAQSVAAAGAPLVNTVQLYDTGVILKITPRVNESGLVMLDIAQEVSDVVPTTTSSINSPTIEQRRLTTTVSTRSGQMIALGGLIRDSDSISRSGFPVLSQIPIIGAAFGRHVVHGERTELIILLTPVVLSTPEDMKAIVDELIDRLDTTHAMVLNAKNAQINAPQAK
jgi:general secretion pathway protein D